MSSHPVAGLGKRIIEGAVEASGRCLARLPRAARARGAFVLGWVLWRCEIHRPPPFPALFPDGAPAALRGRLRAYFTQRAMALFNLAEALWGDAGRVLVQVSVTGWPDILALQRRGIPVILLGAHFINLPVAVRALAERVPIGLVARLFRHAALRRPLARLASRTGGKLVDGCDAREICRRLKHGETVVILADYPEPAGSPTATDRIERLARATRAVVLPLSCRRIDGRLSLAVGTPLPHDQMTDAAVRALYAEWITQAPMDYLWPRAAGTAITIPPTADVNGRPQQRGMPARCGFW